LRFVDDRIYKHVTIAVNDAIQKFPRATWFSSTDYSMLDSYAWDLMQGSHRPMAVMMTRDGFWPPEKIGYDDSDYFDGRLIYYTKRPPHETYEMRMSDNRLVAGAGSAHVAAHFAVVLGCNPIYLVGCDCCMVGGRWHYWEFEGKPESMMVPPERRRVYARNYQDLPKAHPGVLGWCVSEWKKMVIANRHLSLQDASGGELAKGIVSQVPIACLLG
jgi:hypothetical protein